MTSVENRQDDLWGIQVSIAKAIAKSSNPSLAQLHHEILEEVGHRPCLDLVDFFVGIVEISEDEIDEYFQCIGIGGAPKEAAGKTGKTKKDSRLLLADRIAGGCGATVLKFRHAFKEDYGEHPSEELTEYFLKRLQEVPRESAEIVDKQAMLNFAAIIASGPNPTVLKFRHEFRKQYGSTPPIEITQFFLKKIHEKKCVELEDEEYESKVNFAETVANGLNLTILQFRQAYEKVYNETPSPGIIDVFIKNLPRKGEASRSS